MNTAATPDTSIGTIECYDRGSKPLDFTADGEQHRYDFIRLVYELPEGGFVVLAYRLVGEHWGDIYLLTRNEAAGPPTAEKIFDFTGDSDFGSQGYLVCDPEYAVGIGRLLGHALDLLDSGTHSVPEAAVCRAIRSAATAGMINWQTMVSDMFAFEQDGIRPIEGFDKAFRSRAIDLPSDYVQITIGGVPEDPAYLDLLIAFVTDLMYHQRRPNH